MAGTAKNINNSTSKVNAFRLLACYSERKLTRKLSAVKRDMPKKWRSAMSGAKVWVERVSIPTYEIGEPEKNPMFLEKRVYQGSSGKVYPYPTVETISDKKEDKEYEAVFLENEYLKVMVLPQLGGRIQRAYDKTNDYDFVYYNHVIKPALVGLTGPWICGGIEFNWPQHHRPTTYLPVDYTLEEALDGACSVLLHDVDQMYGTKSIARITLYPGKAYIEITGQLYNPTSMPQTFLWWANPAVPANENTQSVFPPDVHAVMDHGKRDVSRFPIATGVYYKKDYSEGVDISRYRNIPVPTSYMAEMSKYDFVGGYDYGKEAGILHVADHHISPGKKQWTWGCGDFGKAWDRNLTDEDGPYVELMTGVFTDNQPDFTWLKPFEEKTFQQYFMPYKKLGQVKNATKEAAVSLSCDGKMVKIAVYATSLQEKAHIVLTAGEKKLLDVITRISPVDVYEAQVSFEGWKEEDLHLGVYAAERSDLPSDREEDHLNGQDCPLFEEVRCLAEYRPEPAQIHKLPIPAKAALDPEEIQTCEELYLTGQHIEQYRHATYLPDPYYLEALKRDPGDIRANNAYGMLMMRRGQFQKAEKYFRKALERLTERNPNPYQDETHYLLGLVLLHQNREEEAYDAFYKAAWSREQQEMCFYYLAALDARRGRYEAALSHVERSLVKNAHNIKARGLKAWLLRKLGKSREADAWIARNLQLDPFDFLSRIEGAQEEIQMGGVENYLRTARDYAEFGAYREAAAVLERCTVEFPLLYYYKAYYQNRLGLDCKEALESAEGAPSDYCFPNKLEDIPVLQFAIGRGYKAKAAYYLGNLYYDRLQWAEAVSLWEEAREADPAFPTVHRNLALAYFNKKKDPAAALDALEKAYALDPKDARVFLELDQLYKKLGWSFEKRLENYRRHEELLEERDDLYTEYITLINLCGGHKEALERMQRHHFHPWEGGEGKITAQYTLALLMLAKAALTSGEPAKAEEFLRKALVYPENLGEGRLEGTKDNHLYYHLGLALEAQGRQQEAAECFEMAAVGTDEPAGAMYYNDQPADMILYQGLAHQKLGRRREANSRFYRLIDYGEQHLEDQVKLDYFAVSLPDFLIFEEDYTMRNKAHCCYLMALGRWGLGEQDKAARYLEETLQYEPSHGMARVYEWEILGKEGMKYDL